MGFPRQDSQGRAASTGPETVLSLDSVVQLQEFTLRRNKVEQATHQAGHCISGSRREWWARRPGLSLYSG